MTILEDRNSANGEVEDKSNGEGVKHESVEGKDSSGDEVMKEDLLQELEKLRSLVKSAKESLTLLTEIYHQRSQESLKNGEPVSFEVMKKEYAEYVFYIYN